MNFAEDHPISHCYFIKLCKEHNYPLHVTGNMDKTPLIFDMPPNRMINITLQRRKLMSLNCFVGTCWWWIKINWDQWWFSRGKRCLKLKTSTRLSVTPKRKADWMLKEWRVWRAPRVGTGETKKLACLCFRSLCDWKNESSIYRETTNLAVIFGRLTSVLPEEMIESYFVKYGVVKKPW